MDVRDLIANNQRDKQTLQGAWYAYFTVRAESMEDKLFVVIPDIDRKYKWGPVRWEPHVRLILDAPIYEFPERRSNALVVFDNRRLPWVVMWWHRS